MARKSMVGSRLKELREQKDVSLRVAAKGIGCSNPYICQLETGKVRNPSMKILQAAARYYGVTVAYLIGEAA